jgi:hypothetical protein
MRRCAITSAPRWPFWLLIVAWVCANTPQPAMYALLTGIAEARQFSHQQQLTRDVAHLFAREKAPARETIATATPLQHDTKTSGVAVPAGSVLKKLDLTTEQRVGLVAPVWQVTRYARTSARWSDALLPPPPHGPPRWESAI